MTSRSLLPAILTLILVATATPSLPDEPPGEENPEVVISEPRHDFGALVPGARVTHDFELRNEGTAPLKIERVRAFCNCLQVGAVEDRIPPGEAGTIRATLDTTGLTRGRLLRILVSTNDPDERTLELRLSFEPDPRLVAHPGQARWITVQGEKEGTISQVIGSTDGADFEIVDIESDQVGIETEIRRPEPDERRKNLQGPQWVVDLTLSNSFPVGPVEGRILVHTNHPDQKVLPIPISGFMRPELLVEPPEGDLGTIQGQEPRTWTFRLRNFGTDPVEIEEASSTVPGTSIEVESIPEHPGHRFAIHYTLDPGALEPGPFEGVLRLKTDSPTTPRLSVPIRGSVAEEEVANDEGGADDADDAPSG